MINSKLQVVKQ